MPIEMVKKTESYTILKKRSGRYGIRDNRRKWIHGEQKVKILLQEGLIKPPAQKKEKPAEEKPAEEKPAEA
jgi:hypothetical protein